MISHYFFNIKIAKSVSADNNKRLVYPRRRIFDAACRAKRLILPEEIKAQIFIARFIFFFDNMRQISESYCRSRHSSGTQNIENILDNRFAENSRHGFGQSAGQRSEPAPLTARHDYRSHQKSFLSDFLSIYYWQNIK